MLPLSRASPGLAPPLPGNSLPEPTDSTPFPRVTHLSLHGENASSRKKVYTFRASPGFTASARSMYGESGRPALEALMAVFAGRMTSVFREEAE